MRSNKLMILGLMGLFAFVGACDDSTGPGNQTFSPELASEDYEAMNSVVNSAAWEEFRAASSGFTFGGGSQVPGVVNQMVEGGVADLRSGKGEELARAVIDNIGDWDISPQAIISETHRGVTFEWDDIVMDYVATERTGAPATGVRFILYEMDGDVPVVTNEIGWVDLIDEGDDIVPIALRLSATANDLNFLDYRVELENPEGPGSGAVRVDGFLRNDIDQLDFDIDVVASAQQGSETIDISFNASIDSRDFDITLTMDGVNDATGETGMVSLTVTHGPHSLAVNATVTEGVMDGTISLNGELFATMTGDPDNPSFNSADGDGLTAQELEMLGHVGQTAERVFEFFGELLEPAMHIVLIGVIL